MNPWGPVFILDRIKLRVRNDPVLSTTLFFLKSKFFIPLQDQQFHYHSFVLEPVLSGREFRRKWARLIQKIYEVDSLICQGIEGDCFK